MWTNLQWIDLIFRMKIPHAISHFTFESHVNRILISCIKHVKLNYLGYFNK